MKRRRTPTSNSAPIGYARRLQACPSKGRCGGEETECSSRELELNAKKLVRLLKEAPIAIAHTGAGLSTAAGIPDFRGKRGIWTLEEQGHPLPEYERCWDNAFPTLGHMALAGLLEAGLLHGIISQNVDGLHLRSGVPRDKLCELHGNLFMEVCSSCHKEFTRTADVGGVGFRPTGRACPACGGKLIDALLDWEDELRDYEQAVDLSERCSAEGGVALCLGTSLQLAPSKDLPCKAHSMVIVNLQKTLRDKKACMVIRCKIDDLMRCLFRELGLPIPIYRRTEMLVISHTCIESKRDQRTWSITVGDAADGARCGYVSSLTATFPGTSLVSSHVDRPPFRVSKRTKCWDHRRSDVGNDESMVRALIDISFVTPPGRSAPPPLQVEYLVNTSRSCQGSREVPVFLGQVDHNVPPSTTQQMKDE